MCCAPCPTFGLGLGSGWAMRVTQLRYHLDHWVWVVWGLGRGVTRGIAGKCWTDLGGFEVSACPWLWELRGK